MKTHSVKLFCAIALIGMLLPGPFAYGVEISASVDRNSIYVDEVVNLVIRAEGEFVSPIEPDLSPLEFDFKILGQSSQSHFSIQNNLRNVIRSWIIEIQPKRLGILEIPPLKVAGEQTLPIQIEVEEFKGNVKGEGAEIFLEVSVSSEKPYVQSQVNFTTRLYYSISIVNGELSNPEFTSGTVEKLGPDRRYSTKRGGVDYRVIERSYSIFPEQSGSYSISPIEFICVIKRRDPATQMDIHMRERYSSNSVSLEVRPIPRSYTGSTWLPARDLRLIDSWKGQVPKFELGKPESRQITIDATGLKAVQLPMVSFQELDTARIYSGNNADLETSKIDTWIVARRADEFAIIPQNDKNVDVPEFRLVWWDVVEDREKTATLPAISVQIGQPESQLSAIDSSGESQPAESLLPALETGVLSADRQWKLISLALLTIWLLTLCAWLYARKSRTTRSINLDSASDQKMESERKVLRRIQQSCKNCDAVESSRNFLEWAAIRWAENPPRNLIEIGQRLNSAELVAELKYLDRVNYSSETESWDGQTAWRQFATALAASKKKSNKKKRFSWFKPREETLEDLWLDHEHLAP